MSVQWPAWYYGPDGQSEIFQDPLQVPDGWHDSPDKFGPDGKALKDAKTEIPGLEEAVAAANEKAANMTEEEKAEEELGLSRDTAIEDASSVDGEKDGDNTVDDAVKSDLTGAEGQDSSPEKIAPIDAMTKFDVIGRLNAKRVSFNGNWSKERLYDLLKDNVDKGAGNSL